jgi:hypothetical protein
MISSTSIILLASLFIFGANAVQINIGTLSKASFFTDKVDGMVIRDTAQFHYENIVDEVMSVHNEDLLSELTIVIRDPHRLTNALRPQTKYLGLNSVSGKYFF